MKVNEEMRRERLAFASAFDGASALRGLVTDEKKAESILALCIALRHLVASDPEHTALDILVEGLDKYRADTPTAETTL